MRRVSFGPASMALIAAAYSGIALASCLAIWFFRSVLVDMATTGGGISELSRGFWQASRFPLAASWIALILTVLALGSLVFASLEREISRNARSSWLAGLAITSGIVSVLLFRGAMAFVLAAALPGRQLPSILGGSERAVIVPSLVVAAGGSAVCFLMAVAMAIVTLRSTRPSLRVAIAILVVSLGVSATLVGNLRAYSSHYRRIATGQAPFTAKSQSLNVGGRVSATLPL